MARDPHRYRLSRAGVLNVWQYDDQVFEFADGRLLLAEVQALIHALPEEQRAVLVLVCVDDMSYRETAEILGIPIGTVMSRLSRARATLGEALEGSKADRPRAAGDER